MVHQNFLEFFCFCYVTCYSCRPANGIYLKGEEKKTPYENYVCANKEKIPWKGNGKTFEKANADYRSVIPNSLIFLDYPPHHL